VPLRKRLSLASAIAVGIAVALAVTVCYLGVRTELLRQVDSELSSQEFTVLSVLDRILDSGGNYFPGGGPSAGGPAPYAQVVYADGTLLVRSGAFALPVDAGTLSVADGSTKQLLQSTTVDGAHLRILTFSATFTEEGAAVPVAVQLARPLGPVDNVLSKLRLILLLLLIGGVALAAVLGRFAAKRVLAPLAEVTRTAQVIGETDARGEKIENAFTEQERDRRQDEREAKYRGDQSGGAFARAVTEIRQERECHRRCGHTAVREPPRDLPVDGVA